MIVKKVPRKYKRPSSASVRAHAVKLGKYIVDAREEDARALARFEKDDYARELGHYLTSHPEKVLATRSPNFRSKGIDQQLAEMDSLIAGLGSEDDVLDHWVLSGVASDSATSDEMFDAFGILKRCLGLSHCPSIEAAHGNTKNPHIHGAILRIDPDTGNKINRPFNGWDIDAGHRALAVISKKYPNWKVTPLRLYEVQNDRMIHRDSGTDVGQADDPSSWVPLIRIKDPAEETSKNKLLARIDHQSRMYEDDTGFQSRTRVAIEEAIPALLVAKDWADAHLQLARLGIGLEMAKNKSGANLSIDGKNVKASTSDRTSLKKLEYLWGNFEPRSDDVTIASYVQRPMFPGDPDRARYFAAKRAFLGALKEMVQDVRSAEKDYDSSIPSKMCDPSKLMRSSFPTYEDWRDGTAAPDPASVLSGSFRIHGIASPTRSSPAPVDLHGYRARKTSKGVAYYRVDDLYSRPALFDVGRRIFINDEEDASVLTALRVMAERSPGLPLRPFGPPDFIAKVAKIAADAGIPIETSPPKRAPEAGALAGRNSPGVFERPASRPKISVEGPTTPSVPAAVRPGENISGVSQSPAPALENTREPGETESGGVGDKNLSNEVIRNERPAEPLAMQQEAARRPDPQLEAAKAAAAAQAAQRGRS